MPFYYNKKGSKVYLTITRHAIINFIERYERLFNEKITPEKAEKYIKNYFPYKSRVKDLNRKELKRKKKYGSTVYFRDRNFTYVVSDSQIMTIEISKNGYRHLNKPLNKIIKGSEDE